MHDTRDNMLKEQPVSIGLVGGEKEYRDILEPFVDKTFVDRGDVELHNYADGRSVLRHAAEQWNAMWLIDIELPDMSGFDLFEMVREHLRNSTVCMIGQKYSEADEVRAYRAGATMYTCRPLETAWLQRCVEQLLGDRKSRAGSGSTNPSSSQAGQIRKSNDDSIPIRFCRGDENGRVAGDNHTNRIRPTDYRSIRT